jgi:hypothetical protein
MKRRTKLAEAIHTHTRTNTHTHIYIYIGSSGTRHIKASVSFVEKSIGQYRYINVESKNENRN